MYFSTIATCIGITMTLMAEKLKIGRGKVKVMLPMCVFISTFYYISSRFLFTNYNFFKFRKMEDPSKEQERIDILRDCLMMSYDPWFNWKRNNKN